MSARPQVRLTVNARLQPRSDAHESQLAAIVAQLGDALRLLGCDVAITTEEDAALRVIVVDAGNLIAPRPGKAAA